MAAARGAGLSTLSTHTQSPNGRKLGQRARDCYPTGMAQELSTTIARAREIAQKKRQSLSTAHVLVALFQGDRQVAELCQELGFSEQRLFSGLTHGHEEHPNGIDLALERAAKLATVAGADQTLPLHLLFSLVREPRSAASAGLLFAGLAPERLTNAAWDALCKPRVSAAAKSGSGKQSGDQERWARARARRLDRFRSLALSEETESKLRMRIGAGKPYQAPTEQPAGESLWTEPWGALPSVLPADSLSGTSADGAPLRAASSASPPESSVAAPLAKPAASRTRTARQRTAQPAQTPAESERVLDARRFPLLTSLGRNLTLLAASGEIDPVIGRDRDIEQLFDVLSRRRGNNPLLVGAPGVGKTAIVEGLALALVQPSAAEVGVPSRILLEISASSLLAGTGVRGALSEKLQTLRREVADSAGRVLLFIDEIHSVLGGAEGDGLGNELKTALARGELPVIGATTDAEYRRVFERDAALTRRFTRIEVAEPSRADTLLILKALAPKYATHHSVEYAPCALEAAVELSMRYQPLRQLPDKAIALIDQAAARARRRHATRVDAEAVAQVVAELVQVPVDRLLMQDREALLALDRELATRVVGQPRAVEQISNALRKSAAGFRGKRPLGTFLFAGPTGVGKTEMAKAISDVLFPGIPFTRIDMSELGQAHAVARLFGAPPGYIGHEDGGQLTEAVRHRPYQLVLLDEIEKAHPEVLLALLPLLDEGRLTDGRGRTVDFTNTVIVMTSNLGAEDALAARGRIGFGGQETARASSDVETQVLARVRAALPPELWNRIDEPLCFCALSEPDVALIAGRMLSQVAELVLEKHGIVVEFAASAITSLLLAGGFDRQLGARPMRRTLSRLVEAPLARALLAEEFVRGDLVVLHGEGAQVCFARKSASESS
jgi:ATP-dependent Clp protease ATP-binding subunit ClpC